MGLTSCFSRPCSVTLQTLTAFQLHCAGLDVHGEVLEVHWAGQNEGQSEQEQERSDISLLAFSTALGTLLPPFSLHLASSF